MWALDKLEFHHNWISPWLLSSYPFLADYAWYLPPETQVMGEWAYWIVLDAEKYKRVYKIWNNSDNSESLQREYTHHVAFYLWSEEVKSENPRIYENFRIPQINESPVKFSSRNERLFLYEMEKINWVSLLSLLIKKSLWINIEWLSDYEIEKIYVEKTWLEIDKFRNWDYLNSNNTEAKKFIKKVSHWAKKSVWEPFTSYIFHECFPEYYDAFADFLQKLKKKWLRHTDLHAKNIMISYGRDWKPIFYIIDFWIVEIHRH